MCQFSTLLDDIENEVISECNRLHMDHFIMVGEGYIDKCYSSSQNTTLKRSKMGFSDVKLHYSENSQPPFPLERL